MAHAFDPLVTENAPTVPAAPRLGALGGRARERSQLRSCHRDPDERASKHVHDRPSSRWVGCHQEHHGREPERRHV